MTGERLLAIVGPTASGKTDVAIALAKKLDGEIVSADSMQIYRYMPIGSAQPTAEQQNTIPHHMIAIVDPTVAYSVSLYQSEARAHIIDIQSRGKLPILCGGTGLYVNAVLYDLDFTGAGQDLEYRAYLQGIAEQEGADKLHEMLVSASPESAERIHPNNVKRVIRALEVHHLSGESIAPLDQEKLYQPYFKNTLVFGIDYDREVLYERINLRVDRMVDAGLVDEVRALLDMGCSLESTAMQGLGYKEIIKYLSGDLTLEEAVNTVKRDTRRFAKRQLTWFRRDKNIHWAKAEKYSKLVYIYTKIYQYIKNYSFI